MRLRDVIKLMLKGDQAPESGRYIPPSAATFRASAEVVLANAAKSRTVIFLDADSETELGDLVDQAVREIILQEGTLRINPCNGLEREDHYLQNIYHIVNGEENRAAVSRFHDGKSSVKFTGYGDYKGIKDLFLKYAEKKEILAR